jgi:transglutaminase-like putative cysteine protease
MLRPTILAAGLVCLACPTAYGQRAPTWHLVYTPSHRATFEQEWEYTFPNHQSNRWIIALRYPPELPWSKDVVAKAELLTSDGWKPFEEVTEGSKEKRRMLFLDHSHEDPKLRRGFTVRTTLTATIFDQQLQRGRPAKPVAPLKAEERETFLAATDTFDFQKPNVKEWMDGHKMWRGKNEDPLTFVHRVYRELRLHLPYNTGDGGPWVCSQILKVGFGECARHAMVGTSILRANKIPARTVCGLWAIDEKSKGAHCWGEFFLDGVGWVLYDTTIDNGNPDSEAYFAAKKGEILAGMIDFDWVIDTRAFGKQTVPGIDAFPAKWGQGKGAMDGERVETTTRVRVLKRFR